MATQNVEFGDGQVGDAVEADSVAGDDPVQPAAAPSATGGGPEFSTLSLQLCPGVVKKFSGEGAFTDPGGVSLENSDHRIDVGRTEPAAGTGVASDSVG